MALNPWEFNGTEPMEVLTALNPCKSWWHWTHGSVNGLKPWECWRHWTRPHGSVGGRRTHGSVGGTGPKGAWVSPIPCERGSHRSHGSVSATDPMGAWVAPIPRERGWHRSLWSVGGTDPKGAWVAPIPFERRWNRSHISVSPSSIRYQTEPVQENNAVLLNICTRELSHRFVYMTILYEH